MKKILYHDNGMKLLIDKKNGTGSQIVFDTKKFNVNEKRLNNIIKNLNSVTNFKYIEFEDIYSIEDNIVNQNCLFWVDGTHIFNCGEDIISQSTSLNNFAKQINNI